MGDSPFGWITEALGVKPHRTHPLYLRTHPLYLRFGLPPPSGRSSTWRREWMASGRTPPFGFDSPFFPQYDFEPGVSVFRARRVLNLVFEVDAPNNDIAMLFRDLASSGRQAYLVKGTELAQQGFIDEPLLINTSVEPLPKGSVVRCTGAIR